MARDYMREFKPVTNELVGRAQDASIASESQRKLNMLLGKWSKRFNEASGRLVDRLLNQVDLFSKKNVENSIKELSGGITIKTPKMPAGMLEKMQAASYANVGLIKTIPQELHNQIQGAVMRSVQEGGQGAKGIMGEIQRIQGKEFKRAKLIAVDQTRKATTAFNTERMKSAGITRVRWIHSSGGAVPRQIHVALNGTEFDLDDPPVIDKDGTRGLPGTLINCRCTMVPVISFDD